MQRLTRPVSGRGRPKGLHCRGNGDVRRVREALLMTETITIPGYSIARKLGQGGMASVYLATQHSFERDVALKVMSPMLNSDPSFAARFKREARIVAQLSHASIVPVFDVGEHQSCHYLSMEYLSGGDLKHRLLQGEHDLSLALNVCIALSAAVDVAHRKGFVHRDIKPENILFREDGTPVLTDFGIARAVDSGRSMTLAGMLVGTPDYMSPEQVKGLELDGRSDLYSLGIVFFEILTGAVPFKADSNLSVALKQLGEPLPALPAEYAAYQEFLDCLTAKDREQRFASGAEIIRALRVIGPERTARNRALSRSATLPPGVAHTRPSMIQAAVSLGSTPPPDSHGYASQPTLAWPRTTTTGWSASQSQAGMSPPPTTNPPVAASPTEAMSVARVTSPPVTAGPTPVTSPPVTNSPPATAIPSPVTSPPQAASPPQATNPPATANTYLVASPLQQVSTQQAMRPPRADDARAGAQGGAAHWIKTFAQRSQPFWMGAAALGALLVGVSLIVGSFRKGAQPPSGVTDAHAAPSVAASAAPAGQTLSGGQLASAGQPAAPGQAAPAAVPSGAAGPQQAAQTTPALANAVPVKSSTAGARLTPATSIPAQVVAQTGSPAGSAKPVADASQAQASTAIERSAKESPAVTAHRKHLLEERRERKAEEAKKLAQEAADVKAAQLKQQETHIQEMLVEAKNEYAAGALWQPAGANAADHYREILKIQPDRAEALAGAQRVANVLAAEAAQTESVGDVSNARLLIGQVQSLQPDHPKLADLQAKLQQLENAPTAPDSVVRSRLDRAAKLIARAQEELGHSPLDYHAVDDATDLYDRAVSIASTAPGLPSLRERLVGAYPVAVTTEINNHEPKHAHKLINAAHKRKWTSDELDQLEASLQAAEAPVPATATLKEAGASGGSTH